MSDDAVKLAREYVECAIDIVPPPVLTLAHHVIAQAEELAKLRARLNPTLEQHDANPAQYWADRELERDERGYRIPRLADCDLPKHHLRLQLAENAKLRAERDEARLQRDELNALQHAEDRPVRTELRLAKAERDELRVELASVRAECEELHAALGEPTTVATRIGRLRTALREALDEAEGLPQINDWGPDPELVARLRRLADGE